MLNCVRTKRLRRVSAANGQNRCGSRLDAANRRIRVVVMLRSAPEANRIDYIDGLRGVAILGVVLFHAYDRWTSVVPYGSRYSDFVIFKNGWLGVYLFFVISGFVITMTLSRTKTFVGFIVKRWKRLFPAMLFCSVVIYLTASFFNERPAGNVTLSQLIPGLIFVHPRYIEAATGFYPGNLEGSFWSIFVEWKFYISFGLLYYLVGVKKAIYVFCAIAAIPVVAALAHDDFAVRVSAQLEIEYVPWLLSGVILYQYGTSAPKTCLMFLGYAWLCAAFTMPDCDAEGILARLLLSGLCLSAFLLPFFTRTFQGVARSRILVLAGFVSYPLYLLHENMMISLIVKENRLAPAIPSILLPAAPVAILALAAYAIARWVEPSMRAAIDHLGNSIRSTFGHRPRLAERL
jgi:peptidoglycan/LPS O-acetylase OafA/YrhL